jgi:hypothetical protein
MTKRKRVADIEVEVAMFRSKLQDELDQGLKPTLKENCYLIDRKILMRCVKCQELKERTTEFFFAANGKNFLDCRAGYEQLHNSMGRPCIVCMARLFEQIYTCEDGYIKILISRYRNDGLTLKWFYETLKQQQYIGPISGKVLQLVPTTINSVGMHKHNNDKEHTPDNCFLEIQELNVQQHEAIPCLFCAWKQLFNSILDQHVFPEKLDNSKHLEYVRSQYFVTPKNINIIVSKVNPLFYDQQRLERHFPSILRNAVQNHIKHDIRANRFQFPRNIPRKEFLQIVYDNSIKQLEKQLWKCGYTNIDLTILNTWTRFSFERIDDDLPHFTQTGELTNIVFICRLLNTSKKLSQEKITNMFLHQNLIFVPDYIRLQIEPKSSLDWVAPKLWSQREIDLLEFVCFKPNNTLSCDYCFLKNQMNK